MEMDRLNLSQFHSERLTMDFADIAFVAWEKSLVTVGQHHAAVSKLYKIISI